MVPLFLQQSKSISGQLTTKMGKSTTGFSKEGHIGNIIA
jgi:hypothetical protein